MYVMYSGCGCARTADSSQPPALEIVPGSGWIVQTEERLAALEIAGKQARVLEETERSRVRVFGEYSSTPDHWRKNVDIKLAEAFTKIQELSETVQALTAAQLPPPPVRDAEEEQSSKSPLMSGNYNQRFSDWFAGNTVDGQCCKESCGTLLRWGAFSIVLVLVTVMVVAMFDGIYHEVELQADDGNVADALTNRPQPDLLVGFSLAAGAMFLSLIFAAVQRSRWMSESSPLRSSLEFTTMSMMDFKKGCKYFYKERSLAALHGELDAELRQMRTQAQLRGWTTEMVQEQSAAIHRAHCAKKRAGMASKESMTYHGTKAAWRDLYAVYKSTKNNAKTTHVLCLMFYVVGFVVIIGVGAMGAFLFVGIAHMPNKDHDPVAVELCWQTLNLVFVLVSLWQAPQRIGLFFYLLSHHHEVIVDMHVRTYLFPGVLLRRSRCWLIVVLRLLNMLLTFTTAFLMWAWLPSCLEESMQTKEDCTTKPLGGVAIPVCMVGGMVSGILEGALTQIFTKRCKYVTWPNLNTSTEDEIFTESSKNLSVAVLVAPPSPVASLGAIADAADSVSPAVQSGAEATSPRSVCVELTGETSAANLRRSCDATPEGILGVLATVSRGEEHLPQHPSDLSVFNESNVSGKKERSPQLLHVWTIETKVFVVELRLARSSLSQDACFVLDLGPEVYTWWGSRSLAKDKFVAELLAQSRASAQSALLIDASAGSCPAFWNAFRDSGEVSPKLASAGSNKTYTIDLPFNPAVMQTPW